MAEEGVLGAQIRLAVLERWQAQAALSESLGEKSVQAAVASEVDSQLQEQTGRDSGNAQSAEFLRCESIQANRPVVRALDPRSSRWQSAAHGVGSKHQWQGTCWRGRSFGCRHGVLPGIGNWGRV